MRTVCRYVGTAVIVLWALGLLGFIDFRLCVGPLGNCNALSAGTRTV